MATEASFDVGTIKRNPGSVSFVGRRNSNFARSVVCCQFHFYLSPFFLVTHPLCCSRALHCSGCSPCFWLRVLCLHILSRCILLLVKECRVAMHVELL
jgi:hypothetical protein